MEAALKLHLGCLVLDVSLHTLVAQGSHVSSHGSCLKLAVPPALLSRLPTIQKHTLHVLCRRVKLQGA